MSYLCNRVCENKTEYGYCKTTYCIYPIFPNTAVGYVPTKPKTNADRIRSMTDEELGKLLNEFGHCPLSRIEDDCRSYDRCRDCWIDWLKEEVKDFLM